MTASELIEKLKEYPPETVVRMEDEESGHLGDIGSVDVKEYEFLKEKFIVLRPPEY